MKRITTILVIAALVLSVFSGCSVIIKEGEYFPYSFRNGAVYGSIIPSTYKVGYDEQIPKTADKTASIRVCRNDIGCVQFVFSCDSADMASVHGELKGNFVSDSGNVIPASAANLFREYYVYIRASKDKVTYPDALLPLSAANNSVTVPADKNCAFWFEVKADFGTPADTYKGSFEITYDGGSFTVPVEIKVEDIDIPYASSISTYAAIFTGLGNEYQGYSSEQIYNLTAEMHEHLYDSRLCPSFLLLHRNDFGTIEEYADYVVESFRNEPRRCNVRIEANSTVEWNALHAILRENGVLDKCYIYPYDEPTAGAVGEIIAWLDDCYEHIPGQNTMICMNSYLPEFLGHLNFWCCTSNITQNEHSRGAILATGAKLWQYGNAFGGSIADNGIADSVRDYANMQKFDIEGQLYWSVYHSGRYDSLNNVYIDWSRDMFNDPYCFLPEEQWQPNGEGATFFYPGKVGDGIVNADVIVDSIRLRYVQESLEAFELLILREKQLEEIIDNLGISESVSAKTAMSEYYDNSANSLDDVPYSEPITAPAFEAYNTYVNSLMNDILTSNSLENDALITIESMESEALFYMRKVSVYAESGSTVTVSGVDAEEKVLGGGMSVYTAEIEVRETKNNVSISVEKGSDTAIYSRTVYARTIGKKSISIFGDDGISQTDFDKINAANSRNPSTYSDGRIVTDITSKQYAVPFSAVDFDEPLNEYTHLAITMRNETSAFLLSFKIKVSTPLASATYDLPAIIDPGKEETYYFDLDFCKAFDLNEVTKITLMPSDMHDYDDYRVALTDIEFITVG